MPDQDAKSSLKVLVANAQLSVALATKLVVSSEPPKIWGSLFSRFGVLWGLRGLCFKDTPFQDVFAHVSSQDGGLFHCDTDLKNADQTFRRELSNPRSILVHVELNCFVPC